MGDAIWVENLGKRFNRYPTEKPVTLMEAALSGLRRIKSLKPVDHFWALRQVSFTLAAGEMLGIIGHNGAGKSTLLQLLGKVAHPTEGQIKMHGRVGALLDLGAGLHGDLTGRENVFVLAIVAGLRRREVTRRFDQIIAFAELEEFIDNPVRTYSSGMMMRLAFSVAVHTDPRILLVDEFLSVGDLAFQTKCLNQIAEMRRQGCAIVLVSHDVGQVELLSDRVLWLKHGAVAAYGEPSVVVGQYTMAMHSPNQSHCLNDVPQLTQCGAVLRVNENRFGSQEIVITDVRLSPNSTLAAGDALSVEINYASRQPTDTAHFCIIISREDGVRCLNVNTADMAVTVSRISGQGAIRFLCDRLDLAAGKYFVDVGVYRQDWAYAYDYHWQVYPLHICSTLNVKGILSPPCRWQIEDQPPKPSVVNPENSAVK